MSVNAHEEHFMHVELFGKPALFTNSRVARYSVPKGFYCYDLRGSDYDPGKPATVENIVAVNHAGTVLAPEPVNIPKEGFRRLKDGLNFLGDYLSLADFCKEHGLALEPDSRKFVLRPASPDELGLFFSQDEKDAELGTVGHLRADFGSKGKEFWSTWWPHNGNKLNTPEFKAELQDFVNELRENGPLKSLSAMHEYCGNHTAGRLGDGSRGSYGYIAESESYRYCLRCTPIQGDYNAYLYIYDRRVQELAQLEKLLDAERALPEMCFSVLPSDGSLICVKHGETGYYKSDWDTGDPVKNRALADFNNGKLGVSKAQEEAMVVKSMTGWASQEPASQESGMEQKMGGM
jgi:hypothetical protein